ncbi:MAG: DUF6134 family protein [Rhodovibrionaceae bacterium]|nr:DUF6134 family protein [Rhodovibrionaceae bacterium]
MLGAAGVSFAAAPGLGSGVARAAFCRIWQPPGTVEFTVYREGDEVGHHRVVYAREGPDYVVRTDIGIEVEALGLPIFRFTHKAEEVWREGWLHALTSDTNDDGTEHSVRAERNAEGIFEMLADGRYKRTIAGYIIPSSLWHRDTIHSQGLLDTIDGHVKLVQTYWIGERDVTFQGERVEARGYAVVGEINRKVWYDESCQLVRAAFLARDGSEIVLETG